MAAWTPERKPRMTAFEIRGTFEAEDIDDALAWLGAHFGAVSAGEDGPYRVCSFDIHPLGAPPKPTLQELAVRRLLQLVGRPGSPC